MVTHESFRDYCWAEGSPLSWWTSLTSVLTLSSGGTVTFLIAKFEKNIGKGTGFWEHTGRLIMALVGRLAMAPYWQRGWGLSTTAPGKAGLVWSIPVWISWRCLFPLGSLLKYRRGF